ncbi:MAG: radical SAM protein [Actinomycetes bacterium]|jgi:DNA repair photolyase|nr:MAG: radical SAM protein [Actinomycetota bacterium]
MGDLRWRAPGGGGLFEPSRRVVGRGAYRGLTFHEVEARSILNRVNAPNLPFNWTINPYRGCSHACVYCFARPTHEYLGLGIGEEFETEIVVKVNAVELTRAETAPGRWAGEPIAMGTNTDPYQAAEGKYRLTRGILEVLVERSNPFSILTKSTLVLRDLGLIVEASRRAEVTVSFSIGTLDEQVWRETEPGTPHPRRRVEAISRLKEAGIRTGVLIAPIIPGLSDRADQVAEVEKACRDAGADSIGKIRLHLRPGVKEHYMGWLREAHPELVDRYEALYRNRAYLPRSRDGSRPVPRPARKPAPAREVVQPTLPFG